MQSQTTSTFSVDVNGTNRTYRQYVPSIYNESQAVPVVFNFHGYGSSALEQEIYANFKPIADTANFIIVFPQGLVDGNGNTFWHDFTSIEDLEIDLNFFDVMLENLSAEYNIDMDRVYSTGMSNGGFFSYDLACHRSNKITAIASVSGTMRTLHVEECNAQLATPVMHFHGTSDNVVFFEGNGGIINALSAEDVVQNWVDFNQCNESPIVIDIPDTNTFDGSTVEHYIYSEGMEGATVEFFKIIGGGHSWPGAIPLATLGNTNQDIDACTEIWRFFSQHSLGDLVDVEEVEDFHFNIFPNPTKGKLFVEGDGFLKLFNVSGEMLESFKIDSKIGTLNLSNIPVGLYLYQFQDLKNQNVQSGKLIID